MASTQAEPEVPRNGPESKDTEGPNANGVDSQRENETSSTNGPISTTNSNNGAHEMNDTNKLGYYKPPVPGYDSPLVYDNAQPGFGYPQHGYGVQHQPEIQSSYPYSQYSIGQNMIRSVATPIASKPVAYMNTLPRSAGPVLSYSTMHPGQYPPTRYPTPTLNQLLQPGPGAPVQRFPYGEYPQQQQQPTSQAAGWPMHQPRGYVPGVGFKPPGNPMQGAAQRPSYGDPTYGSYGPPPPPVAMQQQQHPRYAINPPTSIAPPQEGTKPNQETVIETSTSSSRNNSSPGPITTSSVITTVTSASAGVAVCTVTPNNTNSTTTTAIAGPPSAVSITGASPVGSSRPSQASSPASRSMSPSLGPSNNVSPSGQTDSTGPTRMSHSPMATQGAYQQPMPPPPHVGHSPYKMVGPPTGPPTSLGPYPQAQSQQYPPNLYMSRPPMGPNPYGPNPGTYGPPPQTGGPPNSSNNTIPPSSPGPRAIPPHMGPPTPYPGFPSGAAMNQYGQQPNWGPPNTMPTVPPGSPLPVGKGPPPGPQAPPGPRPHTPPHYMKQHLQQHLQQQKMYGMASSPTPSGPTGQPQGSQSLPQQHMGPYPTPTVNSTGSMTSPGMPGAPPGHPPAAASPVTNIVTTGPDGAGLDDASQQSTLSNTSAASGDDASAPSTPRSRKEASSITTSTPHHPPFSQHQQLSHPPTPQSTVPSPGAASMSSTHDDFSEVHSPGPGINWNVSSRGAPASPKTSNAGDALTRLYEFDDNPERKKFLDQLLRFMEEKGSPISACPTISKNPLDLFRLYLLVRDRGGFVEVTKNKAWKDIASSLGIGASSSAAYTLRKHYTKNLFPWECKFDRGGVDPQPIINQVEASAKKKPVSKSGLSVPSPAGSSNSQDSFPSSGPQTMDGYPNFPGYPPPSHAGENVSASNPFDDQYNRTGNSYPPPPPAVYSTMSGRPGYPNQGYGPYQSEYSSNTNQQYSYPTPPNRTIYAPPYSEPYNQQAPPHASSAPPGHTPGDAYGRYLPPNAIPNSTSPYPPRSAPPAAAAPPTPATVVNVSSPAPVASPSPVTVTSSGASSLPVQPSPLAQPIQQQQTTSAGPSPAPSPAPNNTPNFNEQSEQFQRSGLRQLLASSTLAQQLAAPPADRQSGYTVGGAVPSVSLSQTPGQPFPGLMRPTAPGPSPGIPSRQSTPTPTPIPAAPVAGPTPPAASAGSIQQGPYPPYGPPAQAPTQQPRQPSFGWRNSAPYGSQYPPQGSSPGPVQAAGTPWVPPAGGPPPSRNATWDQQQRYSGPPTAAPAPTYNGTTLQGPPQWGQPMVNNRPFIGPRPPYRPDGKPYAMPPIPVKAPMPGQGTPYPQVVGPPTPAGVTVYPAKRDVYFPVDSVEAVVPILAKRRRLCKADVAPVDAWRIYLSLKSGLLAESTWAIDVLNILLFDDNSVNYFSLAYMPGLVEVLLEHFRRCLAEIFTILEDMEIGFDRFEEFKGKIKKRANIVEPSDEEPWWTCPKRELEPEFIEYSDLGAVKHCDLLGERIRVLDGPDWSMNARRSEKVGVVLRDKELFVLDNKKDWDIHDGFDSGMEQWQMGGGDTTQHIVTHFTAELNIIPFVRILKGKQKELTLQEDVKQIGVSLEEPRQPDKKPASPVVEKSNCLATPKRSRSLADVLQRIKKEPVAVDPETKNVTPQTNNPNQSENDGNITTEAVEKPEATVAKVEGGAIEGNISLAIDDTNSKTESNEKTAALFGLTIRDPYGTLKRRKMEDYEDECYVRDESSLHLINDSQDLLSRRSVAISNIFRSLSFIPGNENELAKNSTLLVIIGKLLLLHHDHPLRSSQQKNYDREEDVDFFSVESMTSTGNKESEWWWDTLQALRENVLVIVANISGQLDLSGYSEEIARPIIDGLLHWAVCPSAQAQDPFSSFGPHSTSLLSPQRLSLEALCKLCVMDANTDLILATPPFSRLEKLVHLLTRSLCRTEDQVLREFAINLLYYLSAADSGMARLIALHNNSLALLVAFVEQAEANALAVASQHGIQALRDNPESMGTSLDMLRRAASTLFQISRHPDSRPLLAKLEQRLLALVMSQIMDQSVAALLSKSLYLCNTDGDSGNGY